jgi:class 3 adenylate cyclase
MRKMSVKSAFDPTWKQTMTVGGFIALICIAIAVSSFGIELDSSFEILAGRYLQNSSSFFAAMPSSAVIRPTWLNAGVTFCGALAGSLMASFLSLTLVISVTVFASSIIVIFAIASSLQTGILIPWFNPVSSMIVCVVGVSWYRFRLNEERRLALRVALSGRIDKSRIDYIVKNPRVLDEVPAGKVVSIMFMDIVGFSQISERLTPQQAFLDLKAMFDLMRTQIISFGGMVDKTLGDGMLAYFGYGIDGKESTREHADAALLCAISIQKALLERNLLAAEQGKAIYPLRIGINTSSVFIGNVGDADYFDFTVIGNGVNLAKRFESACQHYSVMLGASTYDLLLGKESLRAKLTRKLIPIKHSEAPHEAYECQAFEDRQADILIVTEAYRKTLGIERKDSRWPVPGHVDIFLESRFGRARINDFSISGLSILLPTYIGNGVGMDLVLLVPEALQNQTMGSTLVMHVEVRWGRAVNLGYLHGVMITNLSSTQKENLVEILRVLIRMKSAEIKSVS